ncbi:hypothetical protein [Nocardioides immobilis]|uniref:hypothetical protein n=1 Tax=Nocardioides immobilis TaxID=2049295 RepID=UPI0015FA6F42|nr:hypothetical protein [Nocardioides immobilis]
MNETADKPTAFDPQEVARQAARLARSEGVDWKSLPQESRKEYKIRVRQSMREQSGRD